MIFTLSEKLIYTFLKSREHGNSGVLWISFVGFAKLCAFFHNIRLEKSTINLHPDCVTGWPPHGFFQVTYIRFEILFEISTMLLKIILETLFRISCTVKFKRWYLRISLIMIFIAESDLVTITVQLQYHYRYSVTI